MGCVRGAQSSVTGVSIASSVGMSVGVKPVVVPVRIRKVFIPVVEIGRGTIAELKFEQQLVVVWIAFFVTYVAGTGWVHRL